MGADKRLNKPSTGSEGASCRQSKLDSILFKEWTQELLKERRLSKEQERRLSKKQVDASGYSPLPEPSQSDEIEQLKQANSRLTSKLSLALQARQHAERD